MSTSEEHFRRNTSEENMHIQTLTELISEERLAKLVEFTGSSKEAIELHQQSLKLGASLMAIIATIEISLRNSIKLNLDNYFGNEYGG